MDENGEILQLHASKNNARPLVLPWFYDFADADAVSDSVIGWIDCLFNIWPFTEIKNLPKHINFTKVSSKFANTKWTLSKWPKFFNNISKWQNFAKSGHTGS